MPALGGAGGNAGFLGSHGAVGRYGTGAASQVQTNGSLLPISTTGTWLTNGDGQVVLLHGLNEVYKEAPFEPSASGFSNDDAAFLAANGFNAVRSGVIWAGVETEPGVFDNAYIDSIQQTVQTLANHGIYTILDFHQDEYSSAYGGEGAPAWARSPAGCQTPRCRSRSTNSSIRGDSCLGCVLVERPSTERARTRRRLLADVGNGGERLHRQH